MSAAATLKNMRNEAGLTLDDALFELRTRLPKPLWISRATLSRIEASDAKVYENLMTVSVLVGIYGQSIDELGEEVGEHFNTVYDLLESTSTSMWTAAAA